MTELKRSLSLLEITLMSVGIILGAGIYVVIGEAAGLSGNAIWLSFIIAAIVATFTGLSYAELASRYPEAGAEYVYVENAFGSKLAWLTGWLIIIASVIGSATVAIGFSRYFSSLFNTPLLLISFIVLIIVGLILLIGVQETASLTILFMIIEAAGLILVIFIGLPYLGTVDYLSMANGMKGVVEAGVLIFFGYLGFEGITRLAEETEHPEKTIPKAIVYSLVITTIFYILVGIAAVSVIPWQELASAQAPLSLVAEQLLGDYSFTILSVIALFSTFNTALVMLLSGSRLLYGISKKGGLPKLFEKVSKKRHTPWIAILAITLFSMVFLLIEDLSTVANLTNFAIFCVFILVNASLIYYRLKGHPSAGFKVPLSIGKVPVIPCLGIITSLGMMVNLQLHVLAMGMGLLLIGLIIGYLKDRKA